MKDKHSARSIWVVTIAIMIMGLIALYSASYQNSRVSQSIFYDQLIFAGIGLLVMFFLSRFDYRRFYDIAYLAYFICAVLLIAVLVSGRHILGAKRWIEIGAFNFQPSEFTKFAVILTLARYFSQKRPAISLRASNSIQMIYQDLLFPLFLTGVPMILILKQPDLGTALLILGIFIIMVFISGLRYRYILAFSAFCLLSMPFAWHILKPYQKDRLMVFLNPNIDPLGAGYTIIQSKIAIGSGRFLGKGWLSGTQNQLNFLPERHTDFIFSVIGEEWGLFGTVLLVSCFFILINAGFKIAQHTKERFGFLLASGIVGIFSLQVLINVGMVLGLCPVVGITLPFISYGRSSFVVSVVMVGILLNLSRRRTAF